MGALKMQASFGILLVLLCLIIPGILMQECDPSWSNHIVANTIRTSSRTHSYRTYPRQSEERLDTLKLVNVVLRHGDRAADPDAQYPKDPYANFTYYPDGLGQLTKLGKMQEYKIGRYLRDRYDTFLGDIYTPEILDARSTDVNRTKMSLELVLAGLWPPMKEQIWNDDLPWQPIPYNYWRADEDTVTGDPLVACSVYKEIYNKNLQSEENVNENDKEKKFYDYVNYWTGLNATEPMDIYNVYFTLRAEEGWGLELPEWTKCVWPEKFLDVALKQYEMFTQTPELTGLSAGQLIDKIIMNSKQVIDKSPNPSDTRIYLYSGHERNIAFTLIALDIYFSHMPPYASFVLIELHEIDSVFGFKIYYQDYEGDEPKLMTIPGCNSFCPYDKFYSLIEKNLPKTSCIKN